MFKSLENMPLFGGSLSKIKSDYDLSDSLSMEEVRVGFSAEKKLIDEFVEKCKSDQDDPNIILASLLQLYMNKGN